MLINEVENIVGLSKKSIRFYEDNHLLNPKRKDNDYRYYDEEDIKKLKIIKFLRELDVPIKELRELNEGKLSLKDCLNNRIQKIDSLKLNFDKVKEMCQEIIKDDVTYENLNIEKYFKEINILNKKERFTMNRELPSKGKRIGGAVLSSLIFSGIFIFFLGIICYFQITEVEKCPWPLFWFLMLILGLPVGAVLINLIKRIKEILGGEEDEASKY